MRWVLSIFVNQSCLCCHGFAFRPSGESSEFILTALRLEAAARPNNNSVSETGSQLTASSASPFVSNLLDGLAGAQRNPITAGFRAQTSGPRWVDRGVEFVLYARLSPNLRTSRI